MSNQDPKILGAQSPDYSQQAQNINAQQRDISGRLQIVNQMVQGGLISGQQAQGLMSMGGIASGAALGSINNRWFMHKGKPINVTKKEYEHILELGYEAIEREKKFKSDFDSMVNAPEEEK